jgi:hypothetical protein
LILAALALALVGCGDEEPVVAGRRFVAERGCPACHDELGRGGDLSGRAEPQPGTLAYPRNLTPDRATGLGGWADIAIVRAIRFGLADDTRPLCPPMPRLDGGDPAYPYMGDVEAEAVVAYLRTLPAVARPDIPESRCAENGRLP